MEVEIVELGPGDPRLADVYPVMHELRIDLTEEQFHERYAKGAEAGGYRIAALFADGSCRAVAGFRVITNFVSGTYMYIDDLVTAGAHRSEGHGKALNDYLIGVARDEGCAAVHLDSGVQRHRAHRFYLREGYDIASHHFQFKL